VIPIPSNVRVWIATGHTDMRRGMQGLARAVQFSLLSSDFDGGGEVERGAITGVLDVVFA